MKKILSIFLLCFCLSASAQNAFGIKAGVNLGSMTIDDSRYYISKNKKIYPLLSASLIANIDISRRTNLMFELGLIQRGYMEEGNADSYEVGDYRSTLTFNQIQLSSSLLLKLTNQLALGFGPYIGYASEVEDYFRYYDKLDFEIYENTNTEKFEDDQKIDFGLNGTLNWFIEDSFLISAGYTMGMKNYDTENEFVDPIRNYGILISLGYLFN